MDRVEEINDRILRRDLLTHTLEPVYDPRPVGTKGGFMPVIATKQEAKERYIQYDEYDNSRMFAPITRQMPFRSYVRNINDEHVLRNQIFAHQRCESGVYVPGSDSDLYQVKTPTSQVASASDVTAFDTHPLLFKNENYVNGPHYVTDDVGTFHNATRQQIKNVNSK